MYKIINGNQIQNTETNAVFHQIDTLPEYEEYKQWLANGNTPEPEFSTSELLKIAQDSKISIFKKEHTDALKSGFVCSNNIKMDTTEAAVTKFENAYKLAVDLSEASMYVIDFNNAKHLNISLDDAKTMILEIAKNIRTHHESFNDKRISVMNAVTVEEVNLI